MILGRQIKLNSTDLLSLIGTVVLYLRQSREEHRYRTNCLNFREEYLGVGVAVFIGNVENNPEKISENIFGGRATEVLHYAVQLRRQVYT